jgi:hypothetical protein
MTEEIVTPKPITPTLRQIGEDLQALEDLLMEMGGDVSEEEAEAAIDAWLKESEENERAKLDRYADLIGMLQDRARSRREEAQRLASLATADDNVVKKLKNRLLWYMEGRGTKRIDTQLHRITVANNGGKAPLEIGGSADPSDPALRRFVKVSYDWDGDAIRGALEAGVSLPFARMGERGRHIRIG